MHRSETTFKHHHWTLRWAGVALVALAVAPPVAAQRPGGVTLRGTVVDADSRAPLFGAFVARQDASRGVLTDSLGRFALPVDRAAAYPIRVSQLGYRTLEITMPAEAETRTFAVGLKPDPIQIEGLNVLTRRLTEPRRGRFGTATVLDQGALLSSPFGTALELTRNLVPFAQRCSPDADSLCVSGQGRKRSLSICVDGHIVSSESPELESIDPRGLFLAAAYARVGRVQLYSRAYVARLLALGEDLPPWSFDCIGPGGVRWDAPSR